MKTMVTTIEHKVHVNGNKIAVVARGFHHKKDIINYGGT